MGRFWKISCNKKLTQAPILVKVKDMIQCKNEKRKTPKMESKDMNNRGFRAKSETEDFINNYLNDGSKGWPTLFLRGYGQAGHRREQRIRQRGKLLAMGN